VAAKTAIPIPVSCVEQGRWSYRSAEFADAPHVLYAGARAANVTRVSAACERGSRDADQHAVWAEVAAKSARMQSPSSTGAMHDVYARHTAALGEFDQAIGAETGQTGAVFAFGDFAFGFDLFDAASTLSSYLPKLVRGYALDALERSASRKAKKGSAEFLLKDAQHLLDSAAHATTRAYPAVGMGRDIRFQAPTLAGAALVVDDRAVHVTAFRSAEQTKPRTQRVY
jgi:hypothetical protein